MHLSTTTARCAAPLRGTRRRSLRSSTCTGPRSTRSAIACSGPPSPAADATQDAFLAATELAAEPGLRPGALPRDAAADRARREPRAARQPRGRRPGRGHAVEPRRGGCAPSSAALALVGLAGLSYAATARILEVHPGAVAPLLARARLRLRDEMQGTAVAAAAVRSPDCEEALPLLAAAADGELDATEAGWLRDHVADCENCPRTEAAMAEAGSDIRRVVAGRAAQRLQASTLAEFESDHAVVGAAAAVAVASPAAAAAGAPRRARHGGPRRGALRDRRLRPARLRAGRPAARRQRAERLGGRVGCGADRRRGRRSAAGRPQCGLVGPGPRAAAAERARRAAAAARARSRAARARADARVRAASARSAARRRVSTRTTTTRRGATSTRRRTTVAPRRRTSTPAARRPSRTTTTARRPRRSTTTSSPAPAGAPAPSSSTADEPATTASTPSPAAPATPSTPSRPTQSTAPLPAVAAPSAATGNGRACGHGGCGTPPRCSPNGQLPQAQGAPRRLTPAPPWRRAMPDTPGRDRRRPASAHRHRGRLARAQGGARAEPARACAGGRPARRAWSRR